MEIECRSGASERCRFLAGTPEMLEHAYNRISQGQRWESIGAGEA
jgi:hypothetical protein